MKNIIIIILIIALGVSGYFNYQFKQEDLKTFKIHPEKDALEITFYGSRKIKDSSLTQPNTEHMLNRSMPDFTGLSLAGKLTIKFQSGSVCPPERWPCVQPPSGGTSVHPPNFFSTYDNLTPELLNVIPIGDSSPVATDVKQLRIK